MAVKCQVDNIIFFVHKINNMKYMTGFMTVEMSKLAIVKCLMRRNSTQKMRNYEIFLDTKTRYFLLIMSFKVNQEIHMGL